MADELSRAYLNDEVPNLEYQTITVHSVKSLAVSAQKVKWIAAETKADSDLAQIMAWFETDQWPSSPSSLSSRLARYFLLLPFLSEVDGMLFFENRLVVPSSVRPFFLAKLHEGHLGIEKTKRLARETVNWPGMTVDITNFVKACSVCQKFARNNIKQPLQSYLIASYPRQQLAADIATFNGKDFRVVVDKFSNWPEVLQIASKTAAEVVSHLKKLFACHGIPEMIVSDNNPFNSATYLSFADEWGFHPVFTSPHYPQSNGHAERTVQTVKMLLRKCLEDGTSFQYALLQYRNTPVADTGFSPAQTLHGRRLRTKLPVASQLLTPQCVPHYVIVANKEKSQAVQQYYYNRSAEDLPPLESSQKVWVKDDCAERQWQPATVRQVGPTPRSFVIDKENSGGTVVRNRRFLRPRNTLIRPSRFRD